MSPQFLYAGTAETFSQTVTDLANLLGWQKKKVFRENVSNKERPDTKDIAEEALAELRKLNKYDTQLHEWVSNCLKKQ